MRNNPIRRAQLIAPFGVGAMVVVKNGISLISGGLDHWYQYEDGTSHLNKVDVTEYQVEEWRLQERLQVSHFRLPPDYREPRWGEVVPNSRLTVPFLRFPRWHFCADPRCRLLIEQPLSTRGRIKCTECQQAKRTRYLAQVPFVAICDRGHIQDFPWREWVHRFSNPECTMPLRLIATGGASLAAQKVKCDCGAERTLANITAAYPVSNASGGFETELSRSLDANGTPYLCRGFKPWLGNEYEPCDRHLRGSLRSASNVYFAQVRSAIYLPQGNPGIPSELISTLESPAAATRIQVLSSVDMLTPDNLRKQMQQELKPFTSDQITAALKAIMEVPAEASRIDAPGPNEDEETAFRRAEYEALRLSRTEDVLQIRAGNLTEYSDFISQYFSRIMLVNKLRETRALTGFTRVFAESDLSPEAIRSLMRKSSFTQESDWLPAYVVYGEGIFLELNETLVHRWERRPNVSERIDNLAGNYDHARAGRRLQERLIEPRLVLLHTLAHLIMNRLTFECGYSSAALRERLYVSSNVRASMAGILIYTAAGDAEGTMGGLVRMGKPGYLEPAIVQALHGALWCSADPVCMEMGSSGGQGPDSCNLAACHNCALVPETACEEFNRFLDRACVVGTLSERELAYFDVAKLR